MAIFLRQYDNTLLDTDTLGQSYMMAPSGIYDINNEIETVSTPLMKAVMSQSMKEKPFTLRWLTTDPSGSEQKILNRFFSKAGLYTMTSSDYSIVDMEFYVVTVAPNFFEENESIEISCVAKNPDFLGRSVKNLLTNTYAAGANVPTLTPSGLNNLGAKASLVVTITADSLANWNNSREILVTGTGTTGVRFKVLNNYKYSKLVMDSYYEVLEGDGAVDPYKADFFEVAGGSSGSWTIAGFSNPITTSGVGYTVKVDLIATKQAEVLP